MKQINVRVEDELYRDVRRRAFDTGVTVTEVVQRLLAAYVEGKLVKVLPRESEEVAE